VAKKASSEMSISEEVEGIMDNTYVKREGVEVIYLAGGCFWGTEKLMQTIPGVIEATSGYANGEEVSRQTMASFRILDSKRRYVLNTSPLKLAST